MSKAHEVMKKLDELSWPFGYLYVFGSHHEDNTYTPDTCELRLRHGGCEIAFSLQISKLDRSIGRYSILVGLPDHEETPLIFSASVEYFDGLWTSVAYEITPFDKKIRSALDPLIRFIHGVVFSYICKCGVPKILKRKSDAAWHVIFDFKTIQLFESYSKVRIREVILDTQKVIPSLQPFMRTL